MEQTPRFLSILATFNNEAMNMKEWLDHYIWQGVDHFYMIDNGSTDDYACIIDPYIARGLVTLVSKTKRHSQVEHYNSVYDELQIASATQWLLVCDLDEFIFSSDSEHSETIPDILKSLVEYSAVYIPMRMFASRDEYAHPESIRHAFLFREERLHHHGKGFIQCSKTLRLHIHFHEHTSSSITLTSRIHFNHYIIQSGEFFQNIKKTRGDAHAAVSEFDRDDRYFVAHDLRETHDPLLSNKLRTHEDHISTRVATNY